MQGAVLRLQGWRGGAPVQSAADRGRPDSGAVRSIARKPEPRARSQVRVPRPRSSVSLNRQKAAVTVPADIRGNKMKQIRIGDVTIDAVIEREGPWRRPQDFFPAYDEATFKRHLAVMEPEVFDQASGKMFITYQTFVVRTPRY